MGSAEEADTYLEERGTDVTGAFPSPLGGPQRASAFLAKASITVSQVGLVFHADWRRRHRKATAGIKYCRVRDGQVFPPFTGSLTRSLLFFFNWSTVDL